jgi:7,8-dihydropterin-6-yl-methyl-4-(beta-D-ribofuranosyl)aminobenzene 5'-phosphate synthase
MIRVALIALLWTTPVLWAAGGKVRSLEVRILSTMLADDDGFGEWGFSALVIADGHRILFDTGAHPDTVLRNARELKIDLSDVPDVILSHHHYDHTAGLVTLRREYPGALARAHVGKGIFFSREASKMAAIKADYESAGGSFIVYDQPREMFPGVWLTGPVPRKYPERNWSDERKVRGENGKDVEDNLPEDQSLIINTDKGLVLISGCGHAGVINTIDFANAKIRRARLHAAIGGFHLFAASDENLAWTARKLKELGLQNLLGAHCTGIEAVYRLRSLTGLDRRTAVVGAVGAGFRLDTGIQAGSIAK